VSKPNIIWIYCDELRADALGCYGNKHAEMQTPNIDSIAETGVLFRNCFCNSPVCVPSRTCVLSGLYPEDTGVYHNEGFWSDFRLGTLPTLIPEVFAADGYVTANFGKVHIPRQLQPWMHSEPGRIGSGYAPQQALATDVIRPPGIPATVGGCYPADAPYPPEQNTDNALRWLVNAEEPYFVRVSYLQPHTPVLVPPPYDTLYQGAPFPRRFEENAGGSVFERRFTDVVRGRDLSGEEIYRAQVCYYGLVAWIDGQVGRILDFLRSTGQLENTILMFGADHGASLGEGGGRYQKHIYAPEVHRVPLLISWPVELAGGEERTDICECLDYGRTLFGMCGIEAPDQFKGRDLFSEEAPDAVYATIGFGFADSQAFPNLGVGSYVDGHGWPRRACIRTERYRLDKNVCLDGQPVERSMEDIFLADVVADPDEHCNLANDPAYECVVAELSAQIDRHISGSKEVPHEYVQGNKIY